MFAQEVASNREDFEKLATELKAMVEKVSRYAYELGSEDTDGSLAKLAM